MVDRTSRRQRVLLELLLFDKWSLSRADMPSKKKKSQLDPSKRKPVNPFQVRVNSKKYNFLETEKQV